MSLDKSFRASYEITQEVRKAVKDRDEVSLKELMDMDTTSLPRGIAKAIKTMKRYREYMVNKNGVFTIFLKQLKKYLEKIFVL